MLVVGDLLAVQSYWRQWDGKRLWRPVLAAVVGIIAGTLLLMQLPVNLRRIALALFAVAVLLYKYLSTGSRVGLQHTSRPWHG